MGYTTKTVELIAPLLARVQSVVDLGAQNDYRQASLPAPYVRNTCYAGMEYDCIDISGEAGAIPWDLSVVQSHGRKYDLVVDAGTSEHVGENGKFSWRAIYNCWVNKHNLAGLYQVCENPMTGNWPEHGFNYYTEAFYRRLADMGYCELLDQGVHPAMGNTNDGWNVYCVFRPTGAPFIAWVS